MSSAKVLRPSTKVGAWIFFLTFCIRIIVLIRMGNSSYHPETQGDMKFYHEWAVRIVHGLWTDHQAFYGLPGYPFFIAAIYKYLAISPILITGLQAVTESFVAFLTYKIAKLIFEKSDNELFSVFIGISAGLGYAFFLPAQAFSSVLMPTSLLVAAFWSLLWWCVRKRKDKICWLEALGIGLGIGVTAMMVATIFFVLPLVLVAVFRQASSGYRNALILLIGVLLGCSPAILHNRLVAHDAVLLSAHGGLNFFIGNNEEANGYLKIPSGMRANQSQMLADSISIAEKAIGAPGPISRSAVSAYWSNRAKSYIHEHPGAWMRLLGQKICNFWNAYQYDDLSIIQPFSDAGITTPGIHYGLVSALGLAGIFISLRSGFVRSRWVTAAILLHLGSILTVFVTERYRLAAVPGLLIMGAYFVVQTWENVATFQWVRISRNTMIFLLTTLFVTMPVPNQGAWALDSYNSGIRFLESGDLPGATKELELAWRYAPDNASVNFALGNLYLARKNTQGAKSFYRRTLELDSQNTGALNNLGLIALQQKMPGVAIHFYSQTLAIRPDNLLALHQLAEAYFENKQPDEAISVLRKAIGLRPDYPPFLELQEKIQSQISTK